MPPKNDWVMDVLGIDGLSASTSEALAMCADGCEVPKVIVMFEVKIRYMSGNLSTSISFDSKGP